MLISRDEIIELLRNVGGRQIFYRWLIQNDLLKGDTERQAHQILGTELWHQLYEQTHLRPDLLSILDIRLHTLEIQPIRVSRYVIPPEATSVWYEFYLNPTDYANAVIALNTVIHAVLLREVDEHIFNTEHRF